jgi:hypothetical protein
MSDNKEKMKARMAEAQRILGKTDAEMRAAIGPTMYQWSYMRDHGSISAFNAGKLCGILGWSFDYLFGATDDPKGVVPVVRQLLCKSGEGCKPSQHPMDAEQIRRLKEKGWNVDAEAPDRAGA